MKNLIIIPVILVLAVVVFKYFKEEPIDYGLPVGPSASEKLPELFSRKFNRPVEELVIKVIRDNGIFAQGSINIKNEPGGGMWFAAKTESGWELAFDGNGLISCDSANKYNLPVDMVPQCLDTLNNNELIQR